jgi:hypothetical protein
MGYAVDETYRLLESRLRELRPAVEEAARIEAAMRILRPDEAAARRGDRESAFLELVRLNPDVSLDDLAATLRTKPTYVAKLRRKLVEAGRLASDGPAPPWTVLDTLQSVEDEPSDHPAPNGN